MKKKPWISALVLVLVLALGGGLWYSRRLG